MEELWKDVVGYEGLYRISNHGRVIGLERVVAQGKYGHTRIVPQSIIKPTDNGHGYLLVSLHKNGKRKNYYIHRLVAAHFLDNDQGLACVNHKDFDTRNNRCDNLEWCTQQHNIAYSSDRLRKPHKPWKTSATKEKHIYLRDNKFRLSIRNKIDKIYPTLEEAVRAREAILSGEKYFAG